MSKSLNAGVALILLFTVMAVIGSPTIGIHEECKSTAIDTDGDGKAGILDPQCAEYPFKDGNGQTETPEIDRRTNENGYNFGTSPATNEAEYFLLGAYEAGLNNQDICNQYFGLGVPPNQGIQWDSTTQPEATQYFIFWSLSLPQFPVTC